MVTIKERDIIEECLVNLRDGKDDARKHSVEGLFDDAYRQLCKELDIGEKNLRRMGLWKF